MRQLWWLWSAAPGVAAVLLVTVAQWRHPPMMEVSSKPATTHALFAAAPPQVLKQRAVQQAQAQQLLWRRDPFADATAEGLTGLKLSGVLWDAQHPLAMINGAEVSIGQDIEGYRVLEIHPDRVICGDGAQTYTLSLGPGS